MKTFLKTTMAIAVVATLFTVCEGSDKKASDIGTESTASNSTSIEKKGNNFALRFKTTYPGYTEVIYTDGQSGLRGNGSPLRVNSAGEYKLRCKMSSETSTSVSYTCTRPDITFTSSVTFQKNVTYMWIVSRGKDHIQGEAHLMMEYTGGMLIIQ